LFGFSFKNQGFSTMAPTMMTSKAAIFALALAASAFMVAPAAAQEGSLTRNILGIFGLTAPDRPTIEYRERAPLVVPPGRDLPPPVSPEALAANPQWPEDPSVRAERSRNAPPSSRDGAAPLTVEEMRSGRRVGGGQLGRPVVSDEEATRPLTREELRITHRSERPSEGLTRRFLTDPPNAFLQPAPSN
jgi:hypothetical protein